MGSMIFNITRRGQHHLGCLLLTKLELSLFSRLISTPSLSEYSKLPVSSQLSIRRFYSCKKNGKVACHNNVETCNFVPKPDRNLHGAPLTTFTINSSCCYGESLLNSQRLLLNALRNRGFKTSTFFQDAEKSEIKNKVDKGEKVMRVKLKAQRLDAVLKAGLGMSRNKVEKAVYNDRVRINGERPEKKSQTVFVGDEVDVVRGYNELNPEQFIDVSRVEIEELGEDEGEASSGDESDSDDENKFKLSAVLRRSKLLTIRNYAKPWKGSRE